MLTRTDSVLEILPRVPRVTFEGSFSQGDRLPLDLIPYIMVHLQDDCFQLKMCSLVARGWVRATRRHLFRKLVLRSPEECRELKELLDASPVLSYAEFAPYFREMVFQGSPLYGLDGEWLNEYAQSFSKLCNVTSLTLRYWPEMLLPDNFAQAFADAFPLVEKLEVIKSQFSHPRDCLGLLCAFPRLSDIYMDVENSQDWSRIFPLRGDWGPFAPSLRRSGISDWESHTREIKSVTLLGGINSTHMEFLLGEGPFSLCLQHLDLTFPPGRMPPFLPYMVEAPLEGSLRLRFTPTSDFDFEAKHASTVEGLAKLQLGRLKSLTLGPFVGNSADASNAFAIPLLERLAADAQEIRSITFEVTLVTGVGSFSYCRWREIEDHLLCLVRAHSHLQVTFRLYKERDKYLRMDENKWPIKDQVQRSLPRLSRASGTLTTNHRWTVQNSWDMGEVTFSNFRP